MGHDASGMTKRCHLLGAERLHIEIDGPNWIADRQSASVGARKTIEVRPEAKL